MINQLMIRHIDRPYNIEIRGPSSRIPTPRAEFMPSAVLSSEAILCAHHLSRLMISGWSPAQAKWSQPYQLYHAGEE